MAETYTWSSFAIRINVNALIEKLNALWATKAGMEYWFLRLSEYKRPYGNLRARDDLHKRLTAITGDGTVGTMM